MSDTEAAVDHGRRRVQGRIKLSNPQSEQTLRKLLRGGLAAIQRGGYHGASINEIVRAAGVARATFYLYFEEKLDFLRALVVESVIETRSRLVAPPEYQPGRAGLDAVRAWLEAIREVHEEYAAVWAALEAERANDPVLLLLDVSRNVEARERYTAVLAGAPAAQHTDPAMLGVAMAALVERIWHQGLASSGATLARQLDTLAVFTFECLYGGRVDG